MMPTASDTATISTLLSFSRPALTRVWIPLAATDPNSTTPAPPSTGRGTTAISDAAMGHRPIRTRKPPPVATTYRLRMRVIATRPMFWAKALHMNPLNSGLTAEPRVSARRPAAMVFSSMR